MSSWILDTLKENPPTLEEAIAFRNRVIEMEERYKLPPVLGLEERIELLERHLDTMTPEELYQELNSFKL